MGSLESPMQDTISHLPLSAWDLGSISHNLTYHTLVWPKKKKRNIPPNPIPYIHTYIHIFPTPSSLTSVTEVCPTQPILHKLLKWKKGLSLFPSFFLPSFLGHEECALPTLTHSPTQRGRAAYLMYVYMYVCMQSV